MAKTLDGKKVAMLVDDYFEEVELTKPKQALEAVGATVEIIGAQGKELHGMNHAEIGDDFQADKTLDEADLDEYDALVLPGGAVNADSLRMIPKARDWVKKMMSSSKPLAVICHAPWILASAGVAKGRKLTSFYTMQDDMRASGGDWRDEEVVIDGNLITSRQPDDIPAFNQAIIGMMS